MSVRWVYPARIRRSHYSKEGSQPLPDAFPSYGGDWRDYIRPKPVFDNTKLGQRLKQVIIEANETMGLDGEPVE